MERGLSVQYIKAYMELMEGYSAVDQIIQNIEHTGTQLQNILDIWQQFRSATTTAPLDGNDDDDTGMHLVEMDNMKADGDGDGCGAIKGLDTSSHAYKDAMDGFLTLQPAIVNPAFNLKTYQTIGVNWMLLLYRKGISGILADEMGLGKTAQVISFLGRLYELGETGPHLVIVPASTMDNWLREFKRFCPTLNVRCYYGTQSERVDLQDEISDDLKNINVVVTTYSMASGSVDDRSFLRRLRCKSMILDEGHMIKNYTSSRYGHLMRLGAPFRLLLTGTPLQNNLQELVSLLIFIMPKVFSGNEEDIRKIFKLKAQRSNAQMLSRQRIERAKKMMTPFVLRRRKAHVLAHLPQKVHQVQYCKMTPNQHALYSKLVMDSQQRFREEAPLDISNNNNDDDSNTKKKVEKISNIVMHLRKAADHPLLFRRIYDDDTIKQMAKEIMKEERYLDADEQYIYEDMEVMSDFELNILCRDFQTLRHRMLKNEEWMDAGKIQYLQELLPRMKENGSKVLLFSQFTSMLDIMELVMGTLGLSFIRLDGSTKVGERQSFIDEFNQNEALDVFLLSTKAGGFGINLASANVVVMYDMDFNPQNDKQAEDRAHRVGQTKDVTVYKLLSNHTIDQQILSMAEMRLRLDNSVSGIDGDHQQQDNDGMDQTKMKSLLKSVLLSS
ncbi:SNF2 family N-terminal domain-domain-containing protein [Absidia repens]|uniref:DNA helicase n=1 Tax=Absidia repens TaxID=90262 RepID=A0A1X2IJP2_9FUNG|nr:SNF2 family N-terminal domain-domain-containing protein [Absidia repens]